MKKQQPANRPAAGNPVPKMLAALTVLALVLIFAAAVANGRRQAFQTLRPTDGAELADVLARQTAAPGDPGAGGGAAGDAVVGDAAGNATSTPLAAAVAEQPAGAARVRPLTDAVNIRRGPGASFGVAGALGGDETAAVLARTPAGDWYLIRKDDGLLGWVAANVVAFVLGDAAAVGVAATVPPPPAPPPAGEPATPTPAPPPPDDDEPAPPPPPQPPATAEPEPTVEQPVMKTPTANPYP